jgi:AraC-like DNA-binding protein
MRNGEWARFYVLDEAEILHARYVQHRFARHAHEHLVIGLVETGVQSYRYRGARHETAAGQVFLVNPGEAHTGEAATGEGYVYRTLYPGMGALAEAGAGRVPSFREAVLDDPELSARLARFHRAVANASSRLEGELLLLAALSRLIVAHADTAFQEPAARRERPAVRRVREYLEAHFADNVSLTQLGELVGLSPFHLARAFERELGLPPHAYLEGLRIRRARVLLERGEPAVEVALAVGYPDQSHFTRRFQRFLGVTPGVYRRERRKSDRKPRAE